MRQTHTQITVKHLFLDLSDINKNGVLLSVWMCVIQVTTSLTSSQEWWVPSSASPWCLKPRSETSWSQFSMTWWTGSRGKTATLNRSLWHHDAMNFTLCAAVDKMEIFFITYHITCPHLSAECLPVCRWRQSWWISWTAWCRMEKAMIITESSSASCKHQTCV